MWAMENSFQLEGKELLIEQIKKIEPDVIFLQDSSNFNGEWIDYIKSKIPSIKMTIGWCCYPFTKTQLRLYKNFDFMITCSPIFAEKFRDAGLKTYCLMHAFEKTILDKLNKVNNEQQLDLLFNGSLIASEEFHNF